MSDVRTAESVVVALVADNDTAAGVPLEDEDFTLSTTFAYSGTLVRLCLDIMLKPGILARKRLARSLVVVGLSGTAKLGSSSRSVVGFMAEEQELVVCTLKCSS
jgi:hypothetical protein